VQTTINDLTTRDFIRTSRDDGLGVDVRIHLREAVSNSKDPPNGANATFANRIYRLDPTL
jgi:hypothetical protein